MNATETNVDKVYFVDDGYLCWRNNVFPDGLIVATLQKGREPKEDAEHIVRCVNAHESLVEALQDMIARYPTFAPDGSSLLEAIENARSALKVAGVNVD